jgi:predicted lipoprotein with Yx(FWY)xxD motif
MATQRGRTRAGFAALLAKGTVATVALGAGAIGVSTLAWPASASASASAKGTSNASLVVQTDHVANLGTILTTANGLTLYRYTVDPAGKATCVGACAKVWPPLLLPKGVTHIKAPHGVKGLTAVRVHGGRLQVFFHGHALYRFVSDTKKGQATGQGVEHDWFVALSNGKSSATKSALTPATTAGGGTATTTTSPATTKTPAGGTSSPPTTAPVTKSPPTTSPPTNAPPTTTPPTTPPPTTTPPTSPPTTTTTTAPPTGGTGF